MREPTQQEMVDGIALGVSKLVGRPGDFKPISSDEILRAISKGVEAATDRANLSEHELAAKGKGIEVQYVAEKLVLVEQQLTAMTKERDEYHRKHSIACDTIAQMQRDRDVRHQNCVSSEQYVRATVEAADEFNDHHEAILSEQDRLVRERDEYLESWNQAADMCSALHKALREAQAACKLKDEALVAADECIKYYSHPGSMLVAKALTIQPDDASLQAWYRGQLGEPVAYLQIGRGDNAGTVIARTSMPLKWDENWWGFEPLYAPGRK